ncbi:hypothetical protein BGZ95_002068 [Linnemannia exigua]|uniref:Uncharacterized protein n=1 Tax=Linnemannia exigua TaxID=604196 RepID=A0AAD4H3L8_9FUNG|nr:hypothetical protein BGZ95_002068 [Linnemannia exigua]
MVNEPVKKLFQGNVNGPYSPPRKPTLALNAALETCITGSLGVPRDYLRALNWFHKAAKQDLRRAQFGVGFMFYYGQDVEKDRSSSFKVE